MRKDLLALSEDDLVILTNRGTVKRAVRELEENEVTLELVDDGADNLVFTWSDEAVCKLAAGAIIKNATCNCAATTMCRHIVRSVFAYQRIATGASTPPQQTPELDTELPLDTSAPQPAPSAAPPPITTVETAPWNPGTIPDDVLAKMVKPAVLKKAQKMYSEEHVVEVMTGVKPLARFHTAPAAVRFLVPDDPRYTYCNCKDEPPCLHVPVAIWAFRRLDSSSGIITTTAKEHAAPPVASEIDAALVDLLRTGIAGISDMAVPRIKRLIESSAEDELVWWSDALHDLLDERDRYHAGDARFSAEHAVSLIAELCARHDALRSREEPVPYAFLCGTKDSRPVELSSVHLVGLGCGVRVRRQTATFTCYLQDPSSGSLLGMQKEFSAQDSNAAFSDWAATPFVKGASLATIASGQILAKGGKLSSARIYNPGRSQLAVNLQAFDWEARLKPPVMVENFAELRAMLALKPPSFLGPRHLGQRFHVCAVKDILGVRYSDSQQAVVGTVIDQSDDEAELFHAYTAAGAGGVETLLEGLNDADNKPVLVAGHFHNSTHGLVIKPVSVVVENTGRRKLLQVWIDSAPKDTSSNRKVIAGNVELGGDSLQEFFAELQSALCELVVNGIERANERTTVRWRELHSQAETIGFTWILDPLAALTKQFESRRTRLDWSAADSAQELLRLCVVLRVAQELME